MDVDPVRPGLSVAVLAGWSLMIATGIALPASAETAGVETIANADEYFPDTLGSRWQYRGQIFEGPLQRITERGFVNVSTVKGADTVKGVAVKVYHDTNPGNHGPSDSYYRRDAAGIVYYGSEPGTALEKQLVPYQIVRFPLEYPSSYQQFDRKGLNLGTDLDGDEKDELTDMEALVTVVGKETVVVPAGVYPDAIRVEARMHMRIHLSESNRTVLGSDATTAWFAKGIGLVKYVERQEVPPVRSDRGWITEITEELEAVEISPPQASLRRGEPASKRVFADHARHHELAQVVFPSGLGAHSR